MKWRTSAKVQNFIASDAISKMAKKVHLSIEIVRHLSSDIVRQLSSEIVTHKV